VKLLKNTWKQRKFKNQSNPFPAADCHSFPRYSTISPISHYQIDLDRMD
jgi:hypothetical protein